MPLSDAERQHLLADASDSLTGIAERDRQLLADVFTELQRDVPAVEARIKACPFCAGTGLVVVGSDRAHTQRGIDCAACRADRSLLAALLGY